MAGGIGVLVSAGVGVGAIVSVGATVGTDVSVGAGVGGAVSVGVGVGATVSVGTGASVGVLVGSDVGVGAAPSVKVETALFLGPVRASTMWVPEVSSGTAMLQVKLPSPSVVTGEGSVCVLTPSHLTMTVLSLWNPVPLIVTTVPPKPEEGLRVIPGAA